MSDALQHLGNVAFREPVPAYKHSAALFLHLMGRIPTELPHPRNPKRPAWEREILQDCARRLGGASEMREVLVGGPVGAPDLMTGVELHDPRQPDPGCAQNFHPRPKLIHGCTVQLLSAAVKARTGRALRRAIRARTAALSMPPDRNMP